MKYDFDKVIKAAALGVAVSSCLSSMASAALVINEAYTAGGSTSAPINSDYVEIYNSGASSVALSGLFLQYASSNGAFNSSATSSQNFAFATDATIAAGGFFVVQGAPVSSTVATYTGTAVSFNATSGLSLAAASGKLRLSTTLGTDTVTGATVTTATQLDFLGYGSAAGFEGAVATGATSFTGSFSRKADGVDSDNNAADFVFQAVTPGATNTPEPASLGLAAAVGGLLIKRRNRDSK